MNFYGLDGASSWSGALINIADTKGRYSSYFIWDEGDDKFLQYSKPHAIADSSICLSDLAATDYLPTNIGVPIFSTRFRDAFIEKFPDEAVFHECLVLCHQIESTYFLCKTKSYLTLIDEQKSTFRTLDEGENLLLRAVYRDDLVEEFLLARDCKFRERLIASQNFVDFCRIQGMAVGFGNPV